MWAMLMIILCVTFAVSFLLTGALRRYALARHLVDIPNARSSHTLPTPRGGGVAIVAALLGALLACKVAFTSLALPGVGLIGAGVLVAVTGFLDDHGHIPARWRLMAHFSAIALGLYSIGQLPTLDLGPIHLQAQWLLWGLGLLFGVWMLNLYNFMDGINGIAGGQAVCAGLVVGTLATLHGDLTLAWVAYLVAASALGFLLWNFPVARIFMGDAGSGFLGAMLALIAVWSGSVAQSYFWAWLTVLGVFIVDATLTLLVRLARGEKVYEAHRSHAYQHAARRCTSHARVTSVVILINLGWLAPLAAAIVQGWLSGIVGLFVAYVPLIALAIGFKAGNPSD
ncbi:Fuc2NAc and GlcNAc transferase [Pseudomonas sp. URIL14HWK12:I9]|nr:Fuc2NAc and GlcNAc transferase [Pseudomonas sp. URIL14HWK12:I12]PVZ25692.1 Fuc2NAc and GlcNAc transferase [Pseudomonas sp. URIL14HWK12:I10]PVZ36784.1 Fuc2NAc and GlcNAc transferase [Pseudomonas sp. URIL14HWK12:I11]SNZ12620.1 Fuc2NAc and GlcNAc transferase [Pseudomonas sp. URIL14HWK12:I9]